MTYRGITGWKVVNGVLVYESNNLPVLTGIVVGTTTKKFKWVEVP